ncbi:MAG: DEAD/DEAH box helicase [Planctomycetes bacterium]|nr:DEAD/DEAH box helicase [Planctomycetota bacterium]
MYSAPASSEPLPDSDSEATPVDAFAAVPAALVAALRRRGFTQLTEVQKAILAADDGARDLRISSQTGSGKTVAIGFALASQLDDPARVGPTTLLVTPTRELAAQVQEEMSWLFADRPGISCEVVTGGTSIVRERTQLRRRPAILVGTPGRLLDHLRTGALDLGSVRQLVLDEADQMLDLGFKDELDGILEQLPEKRRTHLVSATFPHAVKALADRFQNDALHVAGSAHGAAHADIEHVALKIGSRDHYAVLVNLLLLAGDERTLVFVRTREDTTALADKLAADGFLVLPINGELAQAQRTRTLQAFRRGAIHTLIATDVAARGLDINDVTTVVHVDPPIDPATYVHRSGRTGRAGQKGRSVMLVVKSRESRTRRLYSAAKVDAVWESPPGAEEVAAHQLERAGERARAALAAASTGTAAQREAAVRLLQGRDAEHVVAVLLGQAAVGVRAPFEVTGARAPEVRVAAPAGERTAAPQPPDPPVAASTTPAHGVSAAEAPPPLPTRRLTAEQRGRSGASPSWRRESAGAEPARATAGPTVVSPGFTRFRLNWGARDGADARRVLAHVCRRGGLESHMVGAITVHFAATTFEVSTVAVRSFLERVKPRDRRDPHLVISLDTGRPHAAVRKRDTSAEA